jgi:hypothetical protein
VETVGFGTAVERPLCIRCLTRMMLARIAPDGPGFELRSYECPKCEYVSVERVATEPLETCKGWLISKELEPPR